MTGPSGKTSGQDAERDRVRGWLLHLAMLSVEGSPRYAVLIEVADDIARGVHRIARAVTPPADPAATPA